MFSPIEVLPKDGFEIARKYRPRLILRKVQLGVGLRVPEGTPDAAEKMVIICHYSVHVIGQPCS